MLLEEIKRWEMLCARSARGELNPDDANELEELRKLVIESSGTKTSGSGYLVLANWSWIYGEYLTGIGIGKFKESDDLEDLIWWEVINLVEDWVLRNCDRKMLEKAEYFETMSHYLARGRLPERVSGVSGWSEEANRCKWGILRRKLKERVLEICSSDIKSEVAEVNKGTIQDRIEPLFNKILVRLNVEADEQNLDTDQMLKLMNKLSSLLAEMKGETGKKEESTVVNQNNVFIAIMNKNNKVLPSREILEAKAIEVLKGEAYELR